MQAWSAHVPALFSRATSFGGAGLSDPRTAGGKSGDWRGSHRCLLVAPSAQLTDIRTGFSGSSPVRSASPGSTGMLDLPPAQAAPFQGFFLPIWFCAPSPAVSRPHPSPSRPPSRPRKSSASFSGCGRPSWRPALAGIGQVQDWGAVRRARQVVVGEPAERASCSRR